MSNEQPYKKSVTVNGVQINVVDSDNVVVNHKGQTQHIHKDEVVRPKHVILSKTPLYKVYISARFTTTPVQVQNGDKSTALLEALSQVNQFIKKLEVFSNAQAASKLSFSIKHDDKSTVKTNLVKDCFEHGVASVEFTGFENVYESIDSRYIDNHIACTLFAFKMYNTYRQVRAVAQMIAGKFPNLVSGFEVKIMRKIEPDLLDMYITKDVADRVRKLNPFMQQNIEKQGLKLKIKPVHLYHYFGGVCDTTQYVSTAWEGLVLKQK